MAKKEIDYAEIFYKVMIIVFLVILLLFGIYSYNYKAKVIEDLGIELDYSGEECHNNEADYFFYFSYLVLIFCLLASFSYAQHWKDKYRWKRRC